MLVMRVGADDDDSNGESGRAGERERAWESESVSVSVRAAVGEREECVTRVIDKDLWFFCKCF